MTTANYKKYANIRKTIVAACEKTREILEGADYLESNFRKLLARDLRSRGFLTFEEVVIPYRDTLNIIPFGHGFADIVIWDSGHSGFIILELKITSKNCVRQLKKYLRHWEYGNVLFGMTANFSNDVVKIIDVEKDRPQLPVQQFGFCETT